MAKIILGIDPGLADTGYGVIRVEGAKLTCLTYGSIKTAAGLGLAERLETLHRELAGIIKKFRPDVAGMEQLFFNKNVTTALAVGQARGVSLLTLREHCLEVHDFTPGQVKLAVCAYGQASKKQVQKMVKLILNLEEIPKPDDAADALAVALAAVNSRLMPKKLKIVQIASEVAPYSKTGGLGDVARSLPKALKRLGHDVMIITPLYGRLTDKKEHKLELVQADVSLWLNSEQQVTVNYWRAYLMEDLPVYFVECKKYFSKHRQPYGSGKENARFLVFNVAALKLLSILKFPADIIQCHDWQTGLIPYYLKTDFRYSKTLKKAKTIFTIHNLIFQFGHNWWETPLDKKDYGRGRLPHLDDPLLESINFAKRAILSADHINTVSEQYREEIMSKKFGQDLHRILQNRSDRLVGIVNGIDYNTYNPMLDPGLPHHYSFTDPSPKAKNKSHLQKLFNLPVDPDKPIFCMTSRVSFQKGFGLIIEALPQLLRLDAQFIVIGTGDKKYLSDLAKIARKHPDRLVVIPSHEANQKYETLVYAGSEFFLLPSNHEPCGINQLIAMRYGCVPIVRAIGGLYDTVDNFSPAARQGTGFTFKNEDVFDLFGAVVRALENFKHHASWRSLVKRAMKQSHGWEIPAKKYVELYKNVLKN